MKLSQSSAQDCVLSVDLRLDVGRGGRWQDARLVGVRVRLSLAESFADLKVELHEARAGLRKIPAGPHHSQTARLPQSLVPEVNVQQRLHGVIPLTAKYVIRPQAPEGMKQETQKAVYRGKQILEPIRFMQKRSWGG